LEPHQVARLVGDVAMLGMAAATSSGFRVGAPRRGAGNRREVEDVGVVDGCHGGEPPGMGLWVLGGCHAARWPLRTGGDLGTATGLAWVRLRRTRPGRRPTWGRRRRSRTSNADRCGLGRDPLPRLVPC